MPSANQQADSWTLLTFECCGPVADGESVAVVGDLPALGCWNVLSAVPLSLTSVGGRAFWASAPVSVQSGVPIQYKFVFLVDGRLQRWESIDGNRHCTPTGPTAVALADLDQQPPPPTPTACAPPGAAGPSASVSAASLAPAVAPPPPTPSNSAVVVVSYVLPLIISRAAPRDEAGGSQPSWVISWNQDSLMAKKLQLTAKKRVLWVGCPGIPVAEEDQPSLTAALVEYDCAPVFLDAELTDTFYFGFCRSFLWPVFHNMTQPRAFTQRAWRAYCTVNRKFADAVIEVYESGDAVFLHDYHLLLLPSYILRKLRTARVGLFIHTPFPSSEIFRTIPVRDELLRGMLNADLVGFHTFEYARHFLTCCKRLLGLEFEFQGGTLGVRDSKRKVMLTVAHVGIDPPILYAASPKPTGPTSPSAFAAAATAAVGAHVAASSASAAEQGGTSSPLFEFAPLTESGERSHTSLTATLSSLRREGRMVLLGIDEMERLKGVALKLLAFEKLMRTRPELATRVALVQVGVKARNFTPAVEADYRAVRDELYEAIGRISQEFPGAVHLHEVPTITLRQRMELWQVRFPEPSLNLP